MPSAAAIRAGQAFVELFLKDSRFNQGLRSAQRRLSDFSRDVGAMGRRLLAFSAVAAAPFALGGRQFAEFEKNLALIGTLLDQPQAQLDRFGKGIEELSAKYGKGTTDLASGLYDIVSAQRPAGKALEDLNASTRLAVAGNAEVKDTISAMLTVMEVYGDELRDSADAADFLFQIVKRGRTTLPELAANIGKATAVAESAGLSLEDFGASLALVTRATGETELAITALSSLASGFLKPTAEGAALWRKEFGSAFNYATLQAEGMLSVLQKLSTLTPGQVAEIFPNVRALRGVLPAIAKLQGFGDDLAAMQQRAGAAEKAFQQMAQTLDTKFNQAKENALGALRAIGAAIADTAKSWLTAIGPFFKGLGDWIRDNGVVADTLLKIVATVGILGGSLIALAATAKLVSIAMLGWGAIVKTVTAVTAAVKFLTIALLDSRAAGIAVTTLAAHPMIAALLGIAAAAGAAYVAIRLLTKTTGDLNHTAAEAADRETAKRAEDRSQIERLKQLAEQQSLSNTEAAEAGQIIRDLTAAYGDFGATLDATTGKLDLAADGMKGLAEAMKAKELNEAKGKLAEARENLKKLREEVDVMEQHALKRLFTGHAQQAFFGTRGAEEIAKDFRETLDTIRQTADLINRLEGRIIPTAPRAPQRKGPNIITAEQWLGVQPPWVQEEVPGTGTETGGKDWFQRQQDFARELDDRLHELRIAHMDDEHARALAQIDERYRQAKAAAEREHATEDNLAALRRNRDAERFNENERFKKQQEDARADREKQLAEDIAQAQIDLIPDREERERQRLEHQHQLELREARAQGAGREELAAIDYKYGLRAKALAQQTDVSGFGAQTGTFSAAAAARMGQSPWHARLLRANEEAARDLRKIEQRGRMNKGIPVVD